MVIFKFPRMPQCRTVKPAGESIRVRRIVQYANLKYHEYGTEDMHIGQCFICPTFKSPSNPSYIKVSQQPVLHFGLPTILPTFRSPSNPSYIKVSQQPVLHFGLPTILPTFRPPRNLSYNEVSQQPVLHLGIPH